MKQVNLKFAGQELILKQTFRSLMMFEEMTGRNAYEVTSSTSDTLRILYCNLKASNQDKFQFSFEEFLEELDKDPSVMKSFTEYMLSLTEPETATTPKKKAERR